MKKEIEYTDGPMDDVEIIDDFLPPPERLAFKDAADGLMSLFIRKGKGLFKSGSHDKKEHSEDG